MRRATPGGRASVPSKSPKRSIATTDPCQPTLVDSLGCSDDSVPSGVIGTLEIPSYHKFKRAWELPVACLLAIPALSFTAFLILLVRMTSKGPGVYVQKRTGRLGQNYNIYKLRSMYSDAEARGAQWCSGERDPRITPLGWWLRKLHLDELPQIINVIRGDMSFCGPRPERPEFIAKLEHCVPYYRSRLVVRPGITGFSQINLPPDTNLESVLRKQTLDLEYIESASFFADLRMIVCTALRLVGFPGRIATKMSGLEMAPEDSRFSLIYGEPMTKNDPFTTVTAIAEVETSSSFASAN